MSHFKILVQSIVFENTGMHFNETLRPQPKFDEITQKQRITRSKKAKPRKAAFGCTRNILL